MKSADWEAISRRPPDHEVQFEHFSWTVTESLVILLARTCMTTSEYNNGMEWPLEQLERVVE